MLLSLTRLLRPSTSWSRLRARSSTLSTSSLRTLSQLLLIRSLPTLSTTTLSMISPRMTADTLFTTLSTRPSLVRVSATSLFSFLGPPIPPRSSPRWFTLLLRTLLEDRCRALQTRSRVLTWTRLPTTLFWSVFPEALVPTKEDGSLVESFFFMVNEKKIENMN